MCPYFEQWYVYDIYGTKYKYFHSLNQWYIYDIYGTNISLEQWYVYDIYGTNMSILKKWYVPVYGIYGTNMFVLGTIIWVCLYLISM